jgi:flagellar protein FlbD
MIKVTRLNGDEFALNNDLIERVEATPDTIVTLVDGTQHIVRESVDELIERVHFAKAAVRALSERLEPGRVQPNLRIVPEPSDPEH